LSGLLVRRLDLDLDLAVENEATAVIGIGLQADAEMDANLPQQLVESHGTRLED
jgi:hypothetical protein